MSHQCEIEEPTPNHKGENHKWSKSHEKRWNSKITQLWYKKAKFIFKHQTFRNEESFLKKKWRKIFFYWL